MNRFLLIRNFILIVTGCILYQCKPSPIRIDADFPGGNIIVVDIAGDSVRLRQDLRDTEGHWFYWSFRVRGAAGQTLNFEFTDGSVIGSRGPAVSADGGLTWRWADDLGASDTKFRYRFGAEDREVYFGMGMNYTEKDLHRFLDKYKNHPDLKIDALCTTKKGRSAELLRIRDHNGTPDYKIVLLSRAHAGEMMATRALEGVVEAVLSDTEDGRWLRRHGDFFIVPFVDKDGAEDGDQGKNRRPHDHNRDYIQCIYPEIGAITRQVPEWSDGKPVFFLDMHCPMHRGAADERLHFHGPNPERHDFESLQEKMYRFGDILKTNRKGDIPSQVTYNSRSLKTVEFDKKFNFQRSTDWAATLPDVVLSTTIEVPFANASGVAVDANSARQLGRDVATAIRIYLENLK